MTQDEAQTGPPDQQTVTQDLLATRRDLPHLQTGGSTYFITFCLCRPGQSRRWPKSGGRELEHMPEGGWH